MATTHWLRAADCPLLQTDAESADTQGLRLLQRLLELALNKQGSDNLPDLMLEEVGSALRADGAAIVEATPAWQVRWQFLRRGAKKFGNLPAQLLSDVLDREAGVAVGPEREQPAYLAACLSYTDRPNRVLLATRPREDFEKLELEYAVAAGHYLGLVMERSAAWTETCDNQKRLEALVAISRQLAQERETVPLLEHIARQAAALLGCERASIFLWDKDRKELVGRPALGLPNGELRIAEDTGIVGQVIREGQPVQVDNVQADPSWNPAIDKASGFKTKNLLCVPLTDAAGGRLGALEVMNKAGTFTPRDRETLSILAGQATTALQTVREHEALVRSHTELEGQARLAARIVGESPAIQALRSTIERVSRTDLPVLVLGESGTGKEVVARAVHYSGPRQSQPFIPVNCAAIAETLLESELFGHEKGAFTDAHSTRAGKFEAANGGTLFLDEVGDLSPGGQAKLLRVLEEKAVYRVGGTVPIPVNTRIVAATNRHLAEHVRAGKFREDLFYRLTVVTVDLPPLRERRDDVLVLAEHFLQQFCREAGRKTLKMTAEARKRLQQHEWPGNVRELRNMLERIAHLCPNEKIEAEDLAFIIRPAAEGANRYAELPLSEATDAFQRDHIQHAIQRTSGNMGEAARILGLHRPNLYRKMKLLGLDGK
ncbi:MAG: sigma-54-dependent Fis family transcriptional regulator [Planctomycetes bacterium]|nr:sigma-54-dependent Fis family transcriptional regulator [Planctomycetota bacterium]